MFKGLWIYDSDYDFASYPIVKLDMSNFDTESPDIFKNSLKARLRKYLLLTWYDGYSWDGKTKLLNPYGLLSFFFAKEFKSFWYVSGSPKFLIDLVY